MEYGIPYTANQLMEKLSLKSKDNFRTLYLNPALGKNLIIMEIPDNKEAGPLKTGFICNQKPDYGFVLIY